MTSKEYIYRPVKHDLDSRLTPELDTQGAGKDLILTSYLLSMLQHEPNRDLKQEIEIAEEGTANIFAYNLGEFVIGTSRLYVTDLYKTDYLPRGWVSGRQGVKHRNYAKIHNKSFNIFRIGETIFNSELIFDGFHRGDILGYNKELGNRWNILLGTKSNIQFYVPVAALESFRLCSVSMKT